MNNKEIKKIGFNEDNEVAYLGRINPERRNLNLELELTTQLAEDFGVVEFTRTYEMRDGKIVDEASDQLISTLGVEEENESIKKIEEGLNQDPVRTWVHFSPKNEDLGYPMNCVNFWRKSGDKVIWNRMVVKNTFEDMKEIRFLLGGEEKIENEMEILRLPISVNLKLSEVFDLFSLCELKNFNDLDLIEKIVNRHSGEFTSRFEYQQVVESADLVLRLYSLCYRSLEKHKLEDGLVSRREIENFMYGQMQNLRVEPSYGCAVSTTVGAYGEKIGYYILSNGEIKKGIIPEGEGYIECKKCGCWYRGEKCPFC